jgi:hypothetical protein
MVVVGRLVSLRQLWKNHGLNIRVEVQVDVVKLSNSVANCLAVDLQFSSDCQEPRIQLVYLSVKLFRV